MQVTVLESHFNMVWFILWRPHHVRQDNQFPKVTQRIGSKLVIRTQVTRLWKFQSLWLSKSILPYKGLTGIVSRWLRVDLFLGMAAMRPWEIEGAFAPAV